MTEVPAIPLNDGHSIPQLGFGCWQISREAVVPAVRSALEIGYRHIDTAAMYLNEAGVGQAIVDYGLPRAEVYVTTKLWNNRHGDARAALEESLTRLGMDYVDLLLIHWPVPAQDRYLEAWQTMEALQREGLTRSIGVSNFQRTHLQRLIDEASVTPAVNQIEIHPTFAQRDLVSFNDSLGMRTESWSPLGQAEDLGAETVTELARTLGRTPAQVVLRWHLQRGLIVFPKSVTEQRIAENFHIFDFELSTDDMAQLDAMDRGNRIGPNPDTFDA